MDIPTALVAAVRDAVLAWMHSQAFVVADGLRTTAESCNLRE